MSLRYLSNIVTERKKLWYFPKITSDSMKWVDCFPKIVVTKTSQTERYIRHIMLDRQSTFKKKNGDKMCCIHLFSCFCGDSLEKPISDLFSPEFINNFLNRGGGTIIEFCQEPFIF